MIPRLPARAVLPLAVAALAGGLLSGCASTPTDALSLGAPAGASPGAAVPTTVPSGVPTTGTTGCPPQPGDVEGTPGAGPSLSAVDPGYVPGDPVPMTSEVPAPSPVGVGPLPDVGQASGGPLAGTTSDPSAPATEASADPGTATDGGTGSADATGTGTGEQDGTGSATGADPGTAAVTPPDGEVTDPGFGWYACGYGYATSPSLSPPPPRLPSQVEPAPAETDASECVDGVRVYPSPPPSTTGPTATPRPC